MIEFKPVYMTEHDIEQALWPVVDLLCAMPEANRHQWAAWLVDQVAESTQLPPEARTTFATRLHTHLGVCYTNVGGF
jgi:hypothetical protein